MSDKILCIYHHNCADGFTAAWVVRKYFGAENVEFHPGIYGSPPPDVSGRKVVIVDFSYSYDTIIEMSFKAKSTLILDHHQTAQEALGRLFWAGRNYSEFLTDCFNESYCHNAPHIGQVFDMQRSGAGIAWDFFFPDQPRPHIIDFVEDRDLWRFALPMTRELMANMFSYPYDFDIWDRIAASDAISMASEGKAIERKHFKDIDELLAVCARTMYIGGHEVPCVSIPYTMGSDAGGKLAIGKPFAAYYYDTADARIFGLRSAPEGLDVSLIAQEYGGGGHKHAAGFRVPRDHILAQR